MTSQNQRPEFNQSELYEAIKEFLFSKGYLNEGEARAEGWTIVHNASWTAYASNVWGLNGAPVPWNWESMPQQMLDEPAFGGVLEEKVEEPVKTEPPVPPVSSVNTPKPGSLPFAAAGGSTSAPTPAPAPSTGGGSFSVKRNPESSTDSTSDSDSSSDSDSE